MLVFAAGCVKRIILVIYTQISGHFAGPFILKIAIV